MRLNKVQNCEQSGPTTKLGKQSLLVPCIDVSCSLLMYPCLPPLLLPVKNQSTVKTRVHGTAIYNLPHSMQSYQPLH